MRLSTLLTLARRWCPKPARWDSVLIDDYWGPAHEVGHALLSRPEERAMEHYGLCEAGQCQCPGERCHVVELAVQRISWRLLTVAGRQDLALDDIDATDGYDAIATRPNLRASWLMLRDLRMWPLPTTAAGLERLLARRLG